jgi:hypothetical protein
MAIAGSVPTTKIEALANELRFLKPRMADMQGRLDTLLIEIDGELQGAQSESEPVAATVVDVPAAAEAEAVTEAVVAEAAEVASEPALAEPEVEPAVEAIETPEVVGAGEIEAIVVTAPSAELVEAAQTDAIVVSSDEPAPIETADVPAPAEPIAETPAAVEAVASVDSVEPATHVAVWAEDIAPAETRGQNVVVLAEHRAIAGKRRGVIARTARWAVAMALLATIAAVAATGTGFAGNADLLIKSVCAIAGDGCSTAIRMP